MPQASSERLRSTLATVAWWIATIFTLVVLDDLTFGPIFWVIARVGGAWWAVAAVFAVYVPVQVFLVRRGTAPTPGRLAAWFLSRLDLERRFEPLRTNEQRLRNQVAGVVSALALSFVIGGVLPPLLLYRRGWPRLAVRRLSIWTSVLYACEFAVLHGLIPASL